jgi:hypothetical protein
MPFINAVQDGLTHQMGTYGMALEIVRVQQVAFLSAIVVICQRLVHLKVIAPASEFDAVVSEFFRFASHFLQRQIGPLACEKRDRTCHGLLQHEPVELRRTDQDECATS